MENHTFWTFLRTLFHQDYWVLFPIEHLRQVVVTVKRILTKEKIDSQLAGQSTSTPFMNIQEGSGNNKKIVSFDMQDMLDNKIDKLTSMMSKFSTQGSNQNRPFKPKIYQEREEKVEIIIMTEVGNRIVLDQLVVIGIEDQIIEIDLSINKTMEKDLNMVRIIEEEFKERKL